MRLLSDFRVAIKYPSFFQSHIKIRFLKFGLRTFIGELSGKYQISIFEGILLQVIEVNKSDKQIPRIFVLFIERRARSQFHF